MRFLSSITLMWVLLDVKNSLNEEKSNILGMTRFSMEKIWAQTPFFCVKTFEWKPYFDRFLSSKHKYPSDAAKTLKSKYLQKLSTSFQYLNQLPNTQIFAQHHSNSNSVFKNYLFIDVIIQDSCFDKTKLYGFRKHIWKSKRELEILWKHCLSSLFTEQCLQGDFAIQ